jgi:hypothetical protein
MKNHKYLPTLDVLIGKLPHFPAENKFFEKFQKGTDKICPWPLGLGGTSKPERLPRIFLPLVG